MNYLKLKQKIYEAIERNPLDRSAYEEMFAVCREYEKIDFQTAHAWNHELRNHISWGLRMTVSCQKFDEAREFDDLMFRSLLFGAQHFFDDYLQAVEYGKPLDKKFYQPRRHYLRRYVDAYQEILDGKLDFLSISMPKRAGKSQLGINFTNMLSGKYPDRATLMEGTGDDLVKSFYLGCLEYLTLPSDYHFYDIFPESKLVQTNADTKIINLLHKSRFPTVMCRSIDARQVGLSEATNLLYLDDCVEGREEAKNRQRLDDKWEVISGDIIGRAIEGNCACQDGRGTEFARKRLICHLQKYYRKHGTEGWVLKADLKNFFGSTSHELAYSAVTKRVNDEWANGEIKRIIDSFNQGDDPEVGMGLGSETTQLIQLAVLDDFDHFIKEQLHIKHYVRYNDDFIIIHEDKAYLQECLIKIDVWMTARGLRLSPKKTQLFKVTQGIKFLGFRFRLTKTGKVVMTLLPEKLSHERRKLRKLVERAKQGYMTKEEVDRCYESWKAHVGNESSKKRKSPGRRARRNCHNLIICMDQYYKNLWRESKCLDLSVQENSL